MSIRIGIIGAGVMGTTHAATIRRSVARAHVAAVCDADPARALALAGTVADDIRVFDDAVELIQVSGVDAILIASPDEMHFRHVEASLAAGKPVLCEKPLAATVAECHRLVEAEKRHGKRLVQVGFMRRFDPAYSDLKAAYAGGAIGRAIAVHCRHRNAVAPGFFTRDMAITNALVHEIDICRWLLDADVSRIRVDGTLSGDPIFATFQMTTGQIVNVEVFMNARYGYDIRTELVGEAGVLTMGHPPAHGFVGMGAGLPFCPDFTVRFADAYRIQGQAWVDGIESGTLGGASSDDGLKATLVAEAGIESLQSGNWVEVPIDLVDRL